MPSALSSYYFLTLDSNKSVNNEHYRIEITGSDQELRAENAGKNIAALLKTPPGSPILHISLKFRTSKNNFCIYSELYCNTESYPIGNSYHL